MEGFFDDDPSLFTDSTPENLPITDKIDLLFQETAKLLTEHGLPVGALVMLHDITDGNGADEAEILLRLVILKNYLSKTEKHISAEEFTYMCHELHGI